MIPVNDAIIQPEFNSVRLAGSTEFSEEVASFKGCIGDIEIGILTIPEAKPLMVLSGDHQIGHPRLLGRPNDEISVELDRIKSLGKLRVFVSIDIGLTLNPFRIATDLLALPHAAELRIETKVNEHPVIGLHKPLHARSVVLDGFTLESGFLGRLWLCTGRLRDDHAQKEHHSCNQFFMHRRLHTPRVTQ